MIDLGFGELLKVQRKYMTWDKQLSLKGGDYYFERIV